MKAFRYFSLIGFKIHNRNYKKKHTGCSNHSSLFDEQNLMKNSIPSLKGKSQKIKINTILLAILTSIIFSCGDTGEKAGTSDLNTTDLPEEEAVVQITDGTMDEGQECFKIETPVATYYLQKEAGGFSSIIDKEGNDWISYSTSDSATYPASAASDYRGLPNMVNGGEQDGTGHPGFTRCTSQQLNENTILVQSKNDKWQWKYVFFENFAKMEIEKVDTSRNYWFLYEGPIAGKYRPNEQYWGTSQSGPRNDMPGHHEHTDTFAHWHWAYFGDNNTDRAFVIAQQEKDDQSDIFAYLGNSEEGVNSKDGMVVFGFGRGPKTVSLLNQPNTFYFGFIEQKIINKADHEEVAAFVNAMLEK